MFGVKKDAKLPLTTNKCFVITGGYDNVSRRDLVIEPHLISFSTFWDLKAGVGAILFVEQLTLISQNCLRAE